MVNLSRRSLITGLISLVAAPAIVRVANIMPVKSIDSAWVDLDDFAGPTPSLMTMKDYDALRRAFLPRGYLQIYKNWPQVVDWSEAA